MLTGDIRVFECSEPQESKYSDKPYYKIDGKIGDIFDSWVSAVPLSNGTHKVEITISKYKGTFGLKITKKI